MYNFEKVVDRKHNSYKISKMVQDKRYREDQFSYAYTVADMDFEVMPEIKEAICKYMESNTFGYTFPVESYYDSVINFFKRHHQFEFKKENIMTFTGVLAMIESILRAFTQEQDGVVIFTPVYTPFFRLIHNNNRKLFECPLVYTNNQYTIDFECYNRLTQSDEVKMVIFCSPHNPVGRVWTKEELQKLADISLKNNVMIISDEIHCDFVSEGHHHIPLATLSEEVADITFTCTSPSKTFNIASLNVANLIITNNKLLGKLSDYMSKQAHNSVNALGLVGGEAAYDLGDEWIKEINQLLKTNTEILTDSLSKFPKVKVIPREGTYLMWIDMSEFKEDNLEDLLKDCGIFCNCGQDYGESGKGFVRINIACPTSYIEELVNNFDRLMLKLNVSRETI